MIEIRSDTLKKIVEKNSLGVERAVGTATNNKRWQTIDPGLFDETAAEIKRLSEELKTIPPERLVFAGDSHTGLLTLQVADEREETESFWVCPSCTATSAGNLCDYCGRPPDK